MGYNQEGRLRSNVPPTSLSLPGPHLMDSLTPLAPNDHSESNIKPCHRTTVTSPTDTRTDQDEISSLVANDQPGLEKPFVGNGMSEEPFLSMSSPYCTLAFLILIRLRYEKPFRHRPRKVAIRS